MDAKVISGAPPAQGKRTLEGRARAVAQIALPAQAPPALPSAEELAAARERDLARAVEAAREEIVARMADEIEREREAARRTGHEAGWKEGHATGLEEGRAEGLEEVRAAGAERLMRLDAVIESIERAHGAALEGTQDDAVAVGFAAACKILGERMVTPEGVRAAVLQVIARARAVDSVLVRLHPADRERIAQLREVERHEALRIEFTADETVAQGGCRVETSAGTLEARLERQVGAMRDALLGARDPDGVAP